MVSLSRSVVALKRRAVSRAATVWIDTVRRGPMLLQVRGSGTRVPKRSVDYGDHTGSRERDRLDGVRAELPHRILELSNPNGAVGQAGPRLVPIGAGADQNAKRMGKATCWRTVDRRG